MPSVLRNAGYSAELRRQGCYRGSGCAVVLAPADPPPQTFGNLMQSLDAAPYRGQTVRLRAWVRLEAVEPGDRAQLWFRVDRSGGRMGFFDNMDARPIRSPDWGSYEITGEIDADAQTLNLGLMSLGKGRAWLDDLSLEIVPRAASGADPGAVREELQKVYERRDAAYEKEDLDALPPLLLPDATVTTPGGRLPLRTMLEQIKAQFREGMKVTSRSKVRAVQLRGDEAVASVENQGSFSSASGQRAYLRTSRDTWMRKASRPRSSSTSAAAERARVLELRSTWGAKPTR